MPRLPFRVATVLCALALTAAACASEADDATEVSSESGDNAAADSGEPDTGDADTGETEPVGDLVAPGEQTAPVQVVGESLADMPQQIPVTEAENDPAIGVVAPEITGTSFDGTPTSIVADGTPRVIMFVAHWCPHCQREVPLVKALIDAGAAPEGLEIVIVSTAVREGDPNYPPQDWLEDEAWPAQIMRDSVDNEAVLAFGAGGFPYTVYLDSEHRVVARSAGELPEDIIRQVWLATAEA